MLTEDELFEIEIYLRARDVCAIIQPIYDMMLEKVKSGESRELPGLGSSSLFKEVKKECKRKYRLKSPPYYDNQVNTFVMEGLKLYFGVCDHDN